MTESWVVSAVQSSSVTNGMTGCSRRSSWSRTNPSTCRVVSAAPVFATLGSSPASGTLASSRYQSQTSSQAKWYSTSQILPNSNCSNSWSTSAITAESRDRIHRSGTEYTAGVSCAAGTCAPLRRAKRTAFHSLLQKLREPAAHSSLMAMSLPGLAPRARVNLVASAPNRSPQSSGSTVFPRDLDIFLPNWSRTKPCRDTTRNGTASSGGASRIAYRPNITIRATQKNRMSYPVTSTLVG